MLASFYFINHLSCENWYLNIIIFRKKLLCYFWLIYWNPPLYSQAFCLFPSTFHSLLFLIIYLWKSDVNFPWNTTKPRNGLIMILFHPTNVCNILQLSIFLIPTRPWKCIKERVRGQAPRCQRFLYTYFAKVNVAFLNW